MRTGPRIGVRGVSGRWLSAGAECGLWLVVCLVNGALREGVGLLMRALGAVPDMQNVTGLHSSRDSGQKSMWGMLIRPKS